MTGRASSDVRRAPDAAELRRVGETAGLVAVGVCDAKAWTSVRHRLEAQRQSGRGGGMAFTLRNPARSSEPSRALRDARSMVVGAWAYDARVAPCPGDGWARVARYAVGDPYGDLRSALGFVAESLRASGHRAVVLADDNSVVDREAAWRAGIGWYGKSSNLLLPGRGSLVVLGSVVTDAPLEALDPPVADGCGPCRRCVDGCPTGAIVGPGKVDARRCLSWLLQRPGVFPVEHRVALGDRIYGCDDCQEVCPPNVRFLGRSSGEARASAADGTRGWIDAREWLGLDDATLMDRCDRWYVPGRDPSVVRRNLCIVIGNAGDPDDPSVHQALRGAELHPDPHVRSHAAWALGRLAERSAASPGAGAPMSPGAPARAEVTSTRRGDETHPSRISSSACEPT